MKYAETENPWSGGCRKMCCNVIPNLIRNLQYFEGQPIEILIRAYCAG